MKFSALTLLLLPAFIAAEDEDGDGVPDICDDLFALKVISLDFYWQNAEGGDNVVYNGAAVDWGFPPAPTPTNPNPPQVVSGLRAEENVDMDGKMLTTAADAEFELGEITHLNFPIVGGSGIDSIELVVEMKAELEDGVESFNFVYEMTVEETRNGVQNLEDCLYESVVFKCADKVTITSDPAPKQGVTVGGVSFEIDLLGFKLSSNTGIVEEFVSQEMGDSSAFLYGSLLLTGCRTGGGGGDPHFQTFSGHWYDFHGACDMHLVNAPYFAPAMPLTIDVRTKARDWYSYIESAVVQIGDDKLEVGGWGHYMFNGIDLGNNDLPTELAGYELFFSKPDKNTRLVEIIIEGKEKIAVRSFKDMVSVKIEKADKARFHGSSGLMGDYQTGQVYARDHNLVLREPNDIAREWQVRADEAMLFQVESGPRFPETCQMPKVQKVEGRLGKSIAMKEAQEACAHWSSDTREGCVFDVIKTGDVELAAVSF